MRDGSLHIYSMITPTLQQKGLLLSVCLLVFFVFLLPQQTAHAWENFDLGEISFPVKDAGPTNAVFNSTTPLTLHTTYEGDSSHNEISFLKEDGQFEARYLKNSVTEIGVYDHAPLSLDEALESDETLQRLIQENTVPAEVLLVPATKDVYIYLDGDPMVTELRLVSGDICVYGRNVERSCVSQPGETLTIETEGETTLFIEGSDESQYIPKITIGDGLEHIDISTPPQRSSPHMYRTLTQNNDLYRILWFDTVYVRKYFDHIRDRAYTLRTRFEAYETGDCPCITFDRHNENHYKIENLELLCPIPGVAPGGYAEGNFPKNIPDERLYHCPPEPTEREWEEYRNFKKRTIVEFVKLLPRVLNLVKDYAVYEFFLSRNVKRLSAELESAGAGDKASVELEIIDTFKPVQGITREVLYITDH